MIGRFAQADTIVPNAFDPASFDRYAYVRNSPVMYTDPGGHIPGDCAWLMQHGVSIAAQQACQDNKPAPDIVDTSKLTTKSNNCDSITGYCLTGMELYQFYLILWYQKYWPSGKMTWWWEQYGSDGDFTIFDFLALLYSRELAHFADYYYEGGYPSWMEAMVRYNYEYCKDQHCDATTPESMLNAFAAYSESARNYTQRGYFSPSDESLLPLGPGLDMVDAIRNPSKYSSKYDPGDDWTTGRENDEPYDVANASLNLDIAQYLVLGNWVVYHSPLSDGIVTGSTALVLTACESAVFNNDYSAYSNWGCSTPSWPHN